MVHPIRREPVPFDLLVTSKEKGNLELRIEFQEIDLAQIDRWVIVAGLGRGERLPIPSKPTRQIRLGDEAHPSMLDFGREIRCSVRDGRLIAEFEGVASASLNLRWLGDGRSEKSPLEAAQDLPLGQALQFLRGVLGDIRLEEATALEVARKIRDLELKEAADWRETEAALLVAEMLAHPTRVVEAIAVLDRYAAQWGEEKVKPMRTRLSAIPSVVVDRPQQLLESARRWAEEDQRAIAEAILMGLMSQTASPVILEEAKKLLLQIRSAK
jgi:hypothetical protein